MLDALFSPQAVAVVGPNCLGVIDTNSSLTASFAAGMPGEGKISFMCQSGALCTSILDWAALNGLGFSSSCSLGNKGDLEAVVSRECEEVREC